MPLSRYDDRFGGKPGSASKAHASMVEQYGPVKADRVFYGKINEKKKAKKGGFKPTGRDAAMALRHRSMSRRDSDSDYA
jgi:hypothetical protein